MDNEGGLLKRCAMRYANLWLDWGFPVGIAVVALVITVIAVRWEFIHAHFTKPVTELTFGDLIMLAGIVVFMLFGAKK